MRTGQVAAWIGDASIFDPRLSLSSASRTSTPKAASQGRRNKKPGAGESGSRWKLSKVAKRSCSLRSRPASSAPIVAWNDDRRGTRSLANPNLSFGFLATYVPTKYLISIATLMRCHEISR